MLGDTKGTVIDGKYELLDVAGMGGMSVVWRAMTIGAAGFRRPVAIKRILPHLVQDSGFVEMFVEEARVGSQLQHPNIVQIHDFGEDSSGSYYLVMEWVDGLDFRRHLYSFFAAELLTPWALIAAIVIEVLRGLASAHTRAEGTVVHRDVNPQNVLIGNNGIVKLMDFGLSRAMDRGRITNPDVIKGKLSYMAPELTYGAEATAKSDLFSVGVMLWEALSGRKLFVGASDVDVVVGVREAKIPQLEELRPDLPEALCALIHSALEVNPVNRIESSENMSRALAKMLRGVDRRTDAPTIARSVQLAKERLSRLPQPPPTGEVPIA